MTIIKFIMNEKALKMAEKENKIVAIVEINSNKKEISKTMERLYGIKVEKVNTSITPRGEKKAIIKLAKDVSAIDFYAKIGLL